MKPAIRFIPIDRGHAEVSARYERKFTPAVRFAAGVNRFCGPSYCRVSPDRLSCARQIARRIAGIGRGRMGKRGSRIRFGDAAARPVRRSSYPVGLPFGTIVRWFRNCCCRRTKVRVRSYPKGDLPVVAWRYRCYHSIGCLPMLCRYSLAREKWRQPKKPR